MDGGDSRDLLLVNVTIDHQHHRDRGFPSGDVRHHSFRIEPFCWGYYEGGGAKGEGIGHRLGHLGGRIGRVDLHHIASRKRGRKYGLPHFPIPKIGLGS
jgi:hypothetical protein